MPARIRLQRKGKKGQPFYQIVIADGRAPRDGKYIERIGTYNPLTIPAEITIDDERAIYWLQAGAQPTDTVRNIFDLMVDDNPDTGSRILSNCCSVITSLVDKELGNLLFINMIRTAGTCV